MKKLFLVLFFGGFFVFFLLLSLNRFNSLQVFYYDFGLFLRAIWLPSRFVPPVIDHIILGPIMILGDHFEPSIFLLSPIFWITNNIKILLIEQSLVTVISGYLIYKISKQLKLRSYLALTISFVFLIFTGTISPLVTDWHPESTALIFLLLFIYYVLKNNLKIAFLFAIVFLGFKESNPVTLFPVLVFILLTYKDRRRFALILMLVSLTWFFVATQLLIPYFSNGQFLYSPSIPSINQEKIKLMTDSYISFGYLPIFSLFGILTTFTEFLIRFVTTKSTNFTLNMHYSVYLSAYLAIGSAFTISRIKNINLQKIFMIYLVIAALISARKITYSPINLVINPIFWKNIQLTNSFEPIAKLIPKDKSVMAQNNLLIYFANRKPEVYLLTEDYKKYNPDYVVFELSENQNINNFWGPDGNTSLEHIKKIDETLKNDRDYKIMEINNQFLRIYSRQH